MRIFNKMKAAMLVLMASLFCANAAFAETQTVYSWESPDGNPVEEGGVIAYTNGNASKDRLNYPNASYYTICLNGKKANINDETASDNAGHMLLTLNDALQEGDVISVTAYRNKGTGAESSIYFLFENGQVWEDTKSFADILDGEGVMPSTNTWEVTAAEAGCKTIKLTRNTSGTNLFITKLVITREVAAPKVAYLNDASDETEAIYTALVNAGMEVTLLNWSTTTLTEEIVANDLVGKYDLVVLAGSTGSGANLAKSANLLVGKVNVLSTKSFWYKYYGTNGGNPGTAETPSLSLVKTVAGHPIFAGIEGDEFAVFNDMGKSSGRYLQSNGSFNETVGLTQTTLATTNGADCIGEGWLNGCGYVIIPVDGLQPEGYLTAAGQTLFANAAQYLVDGVPYVALDLTAYNEAVAAAEAFKATLAADTYFEKEMIEELIVAIDEAVVFAQEGVDMAATQEDVDISTNMLNETVGMYKGNYDAQVAGFKVEEARMAGQEALAKYPEETRVDNAGLVEALMNLPMRTMGYTAEQLMAAADAVMTAIPAFEKENNQVILDAAKKKATDYAATLDVSEETGTMAQMEAYNGLTYYTSDDFFAGEGKDITVDNYEMVMTYSQMIDGLIAQYDPMIQKEKSMMAASKAATEAQETMASYENATDEAGLAAAIAKVNEILGELNMWDTMYTVEDLNAAVDALAAARVAFEKENGVCEGVAYYMKNVASGKFLNGGNSWGTQASLLEHGFDVTLIEQEGGKYAIDTNVPNGAKRYLGSNGYVDSDLAAWTLTRVAKRVYTISLDGTNFIGSDGSSIVNLALTDATDPAAQWQFVTKDDLVAALDGATEANPVDATFFIVGQNFNRADANRNAAWQGGAAFGGNNDNFCAEKWNCNFDVYQDLAGLPNGYYKVSVQGFYRAGWGGATSMDRNAYFYAGANQTPLLSINAEAGNSVFEGGNVSTVEGLGIVPNNMATASTGFTAGLYADNELLALVTDGTLRVGIKKDVLIGGDWTIFDNFELSYIGAAIPSVFASAVDSLNAAIADANAWKATLNAENEVEAQVIAQVEQGMLPAAQAVAAQPASIAQIEEMIASVNMFVAQTSMTLGQMKAAEAQTLFAGYENPTDDVEFEASFTEVFTIANNLATGTATWEELDAAINKMYTARQSFVVQNLSTPAGNNEAANAVRVEAELAILNNIPTPTATTVDVIGKHRVVGLSCEYLVDVEVFYSIGDETMAEKGIYTAPFAVSETTTVYAYAEFINSDRTRYTSDTLAIEIEAGAEVALNAPVVEKTAEGIVITSDQSDVMGAPADTIEYAVYKKNAESGAYETAPYASGIYTETLATNWASGDYKVVAKSVAFGYATAESAALEVEVRTVAYLCGAETTTEAIYTALVNSGLTVTPLNYDNVTLTDADVEALAAYDLVVLAGNTGSGTNLAKSANKLLGKVNVLSTKSFWYKHYGTNGTNPGTADTPSRSLVKTVADHPIFAGIEGDEFEVFNDMAKETGRYLQGNGSFKEGLTQTALAQANGADCVGEGWLNGYGYVIIPVDGIQPEGYLTAAGEALFANAAWYLIDGEQYVASGDVTDNPFGIEGIELGNSPADIYDINGRMVKKNATSLEGLQKGLYFIKGKKVLVK